MEGVLFANKTFTTTRIAVFNLRPFQQSRFRLLEPFLSASLSFHYLFITIATIFDARAQGRSHAAMAPQRPHRPGTIVILTSLFPSRTRNQSPFSLHASTFGGTPVSSISMYRVIHASPRLQFRKPAFGGFRQQELSMKGPLARSILPACSNEVQIACTISFASVRCLEMAEAEHGRETYPPSSRLDQTTYSS